MQHYCANCTTRRGRPAIDKDRLPSTDYQQENLVKHTSATSLYDMLSVFDSSSTAHYVNCLQEAVAQGAMEIDAKGRMNFLYCPSAGSALGTLFRQRGTQAERVDTVVVALAAQPDKAHAFLTNSGEYSAYRCLECGEAVL